MINISHLTKIYKSRKREFCAALKDINLNLPDTGLVFVVGKSGSGKSTLLNLIGGLDNVTSGSIEVNGNDLAKFRENNFCNYRNTHIGFIFQDYHLIDELTIYDNIALSLNLRHEDDREKVLQALSRVDLEGYENRYPTELSGGEQQRVAIARAIVKSPRIILADEPTGNLDTNTARSIVELLKRLSEECLILIVSHNMNDANTYADRIIELRKGEIIYDQCRNPEFPNEIILAGEELVYPEGAALSDGDIELLNQNPAKKIVKRKDKFLPTKEDKKEGKKVKIENKNLAFAKETLLAGKFLKSKAVVISISSLIVAMIMIVMSMAQTIISFDEGRVLQDEMWKNQQESLWLNKVASADIQQLLARNYRIPVGENDVQTLKDAGYKGDIYPVLNHTVSVTSRGASVLGLGDSYFGNSPYITSSFGTMIVGDDFLAKKFGNYEYAARVDDFMPYGVIITDYLADAILALNSKYKGKTYEDIVGVYYLPTNSIPNIYINGIIDTGYKERYAELFERITQDKTFKMTDYLEDEDFQTFVNEVYDKLGYSFTTNADFVAAHKNSHLAAYPAHYKLNFNGLRDFTTTPNSYIINSKYQSSYINTENLFNKSWYYTTTAPEIPEGAKYIRVTYHLRCYDAGLIDLEIFKKEHATLVFSNGDAVSQEKMNLLSGYLINPYDGSVEERSSSSELRVSDYIEIPEDSVITEISSITSTRYAFCAFYDENKKFISSVMAEPGETLPEASIRMNQKHYNTIFGTDYTDATIGSFVPHKVTLSQYRYDDVGNENPLFTKEVTIVGLLPSNQSRTMDASEDVSELFLKDAVFAHSLYLDGTDGIEAALKLTDELNYQHQSVALEGIHTMTKAVVVFASVFRLVAIFLCAAAIFILMTFSTKMIKDKMHEIGILKALGAKNSTVGAIFGLQIGMIALLTCAISTIGYFFLIGFANDVLFESMQILVPSQVVLDLDFFAFMPKVAIINCVFVFTLALISLIVPMIKIKAIKPVKIIKAKE